MTQPAHRTRYKSPWKLTTRLRRLIWIIVWFTCCRFTPKLLKKWRLLVLRCFGAVIDGAPFVHQRAIIYAPWNLEIGDHACIGECANVYNLDKITIAERAVVAQEVLLCAGSHDITDLELPLVTDEIYIGPEVFIGARALILPGVRLAEGSVIGAGSVVTKSTKAWTVYAGNPAKVVKPRSVSDFKG